MKNTAEIKIKLFREIDNIPEQYLPDLQTVIEGYLAKVKSQVSKKHPRKIGIMPELVTYMAPDFNAPLEDFESYMH
ncbi:MAG: DUF2281 domain-containing protein [Saprospiraceae bacterium]